MLPLVDGAKDDLEEARDRVRGLRDSSLRESNVA